MFTATLFTITRTWKQPKYPSMEEWVNTHTHTHTHTIAYYSTIKKKIMPFAVAFMDLRDCHIEYSKPDRERQILYIIYTWNLKKENSTCESIYSTEIESQM